MKIYKIVGCKEQSYTVIVYINFQQLFKTFILGGEICSTFDAPDLIKLGHCDLIEEIMIGEDKLIKFSGMSYPMLLFTKLLLLGKFVFLHVHSTSELFTSIKAPYMSSP